MTSKEVLMELGRVLSVIYKLKGQRWCAVSSVVGDTARGRGDGLRNGTGGERNLQDWIVSDWKRGCAGRVLTWGRRVASVKKTQEVRWSRWKAGGL